jgi:hypothetical protein
MYMPRRRRFVLRLRLRRPPHTYRDPFFADPAVVEYDYRRMQRSG